jgi:outer membrane translocation and assembly module TamA
MKMAVRGGTEQYKGIPVDLRACEKIPVCLRFRAGGAGQIAGWWYKRGHEHGRHNSAIVTECE